MHCLPTPSSQLSTIQFSSSENFDVLNSLDPKKSPGHDNISPYIYKFCASSLANTVSLLFTVIVRDQARPNAGNALSSGGDCWGVNPTGSSQASRTITQ